VTIEIPDVGVDTLTINVTFGSSPPLSFLGDSRSVNPQDLEQTAQFLFPGAEQASVEVMGFSAGMAVATGTIALTLVSNEIVIDRLVLAPI